MMVRMYDAKTDAEAVRALCKPTDLNSLDQIIIVTSETDGHMVAAVAIRPVCLVHELGVEPLFVTRRAVDLAMAYAFGAAHSQGAREAIFLVAQDNVAMHNYVNGHGAVREPDQAVYGMEIR